MKSTKVAAAKVLELGVADEVWVAMCLLHIEHPDRQDFAIREVVERAAREGLHARRRPGLYVHVVQHGVANRPANPGRYRMLYETRPGHRKLFSPADGWHPDRSEGRTRPPADALPASHRHLLDWYEGFAGEKGDAVDPILALRGLGRDLWQDQDADGYVAGLRQGWE